MPAKRRARRSRRPILASGRASIAVNLNGVYLVSRAVLSDLKARGAGARIINIASTAGLVGYAYVAAYCAAKQRLIGLTRALALEFARTGITVNAVCPGFTETPLVARAVETIVAKTGRSEELAKAELTQVQSARAPGAPEEVADAVALAGVARRGVDKRSGDRGRRRGGDGRMNTPNAMQAMRRSDARLCRAALSLHRERGRAGRDDRAQPPRAKNPLTFESYAELRDLFRDLAQGSDVRAIVLTGAGGNFSSGGDVFEIIEPLTRMAMPDLIAFTRMTGDVVKAMRKCPQPIIAAVDGICAGAGAILAMASDLRLATPEAKTAFLFTRVGLAGADMGACGILPRIIGQGRAAELLFTGRTMSAAEGSAWGFYNALHPSADLERGGACAGPLAC